MALGEQNQIVIPQDPTIAEEQFRKFMLELLSAEAYDRSAEEQMSFSFDMLKKILSRFCDIIARHLECESCTINLQLYDPDQVDKETFLGWINDYFVYRNRDNKEDKKLFSEWFKMYRLKKTSAEQEQYRFFNNRTNNVLKNHMAFPYWRHGKGLSLLVATNPSGPWTPVLLKGKENLKYRAMESGVTLDIYQGNTARLRDRLNMRETRHLRKLGRDDIIVWNNLDWHGIFKNYYGVPIRIHSDGEVVGILKVENKCDEGECKKDDGTQNPAGPEELLDKDVANFADFLDKHYGYEGPEEAIKKLNVSLLSLAYLMCDIGVNTRENPNSGSLGNSGHCSKGLLRDYLLLPYPQAISEAVKCFKEGIAELFENKQEGTKKDIPNISPIDLQNIVS